MKMTINNTTAIVRNGRIIYQNSTTGRTTHIERIGFTWPRPFRDAIRRIIMSQTTEPFLCPMTEEELYKAAAQHPTLLGFTCKDIEKYGTILIYGFEKSADDGELTSISVVVDTTRETLVDAIIKRFSECTF